MRERSNGKVSWLEFPLFDSLDWLTHAVSLNKATSNSLWLKEFLPEGKPFYSLKQVHGIAAQLPSPAEKEGDIFLSLGNEALTIRHADCQAALFVDRRAKAFAVVHAGWRGQMEEIYAIAMAKMKERFQTNPRDLLVAIGPSLGPESSQFLHYASEIPSRYWSYQFKPYYFNLWKLAEDQLLSLGIPLDQIEIARIDTAQDARFHSYRRDRETLRQVTVAFSTHQPELLDR